MKRALTALAMALSMYTAVPLPLKRWDENSRPLMLVFLPVVGLVLGLLWYGLALLMGVLALPGAVCAALLTLYPYLITGHLHLDGFMDCADAILSRRSLEEKQKILKDPHVGAFAVISLAALFLLGFAIALSAGECGAACPDFRPDYRTLRFSPLRREFLPPVRQPIRRRL